MIRRTLKDVKPDLARIAGAVGMQSTDSRVLDYLNLATEELMNEADFPALIDRYNFKVYGGKITLPGAYERILHTKVNDTVVTMQSPWYEFVGYGPQLVTDSHPSDENQLNYIAGLDGVLDRDNVLLYRDIPSDLSTQQAFDLGFSEGFGNTATYKIRLETEMDERIDGQSPDNVVIVGRNTSGLIPRTSHNGIYQDGESLSWTTNSGIQWAESSDDYVDLLSAYKPLTRRGIKVFIVSSETGTKEQVGYWDAKETSPSYRRYYIPGLSIDKQYSVSTRLRRRYVPVVNDTDQLIISNIPALRAMILAIYYFEIGKIDQYAANKIVAIDILNSEAKAFRGQQRRKPLITFSEGTGVRRDGFYVI